MATAKFVVRKGRTGKFRFSLVGPNGRVIATSHTYESRTSALRAIESARRYAPNAELVDQAGTRVVGDGTKRRAAKRSRTLPASDVGVVPSGDEAASGST